jgi:hypothetical protein
MSLALHVSINEYRFTDAFAPATVSLKSQFFLQCNYVHCRNNVELEIMCSPSLSKGAMRIAEAIRKDSWFGELRIIQRLQELQDVVRWSISTILYLWRLNPVQCSFLHCQISFHVAMCCRRAFVSQPQGDDRQVDA